MLITKWHTHTRAQRFSGGIIAFSRSVSVLLRLQLLRGNFLGRRMRVRVMYSSFILLRGIPNFVHLLQLFLYPNAATLIYSMKNENENMHKRKVCVLSVVNITFLCIAQVHTAAGMLSNHPIHNMFQQLYNNLKRTVFGMPSNYVACHNK